MRYVTLILLVFTAASYALLHDQLAQDESDLWVGDNQGTPFSAISFSTINGAYDRWVANDYEPTETVRATGFAAHYGYYNDNHSPGDFYIEIYENDLNSSPIGLGFVDVNDLNETDTGWNTPTSGVTVWLGEMTFPAITGLTAGNTYWFAIQIDSAENVFNCCVEHLYWEEMYWFGDDAIWIPGSAQWPGNVFETSVRMDGTTGIESASLGEIKASFK